MQEIIIKMLEQYGYFGVAFLIAAENLFPPIPSEVILTFSGFMTTYANLNVWIVIISATIGADIGAIILYFIGRMVSTEHLNRLISGKLGRFLRLKPKDLVRTREVFSKRSVSTVFFCRFIPIIRSLISIPAGTAKMNFLGFIGFTTLGTLIWNTVLVWLGVYAGEKWAQIVNYMNTYSLIVMCLFIVVGLCIGYHLFKRKSEEYEINQHEH